MSITSIVGADESRTSYTGSSQQNGGARPGAILHLPAHHSSLSAIWLGYNRTTLSRITYKRLFTSRVTLQCAFKLNIKINSCQALLAMPVKSFITNIWRKKIYLPPFLYFQWFLLLSDLHKIKMGLTRLRWLHIVS